MDTGAERGRKRKAVEVTRDGASSMAAVDATQPWRRSSQQANHLDVSTLSAQAHSVLRQPSSGSVQPPIGREQQSQLLENAVQGFLVSGNGTSLYVSGLPGTGKSHTVRKVLQQLSSSNPEEVTITWVNCMSISAAGQVYSHIGSSTAKGGFFQSASLSSSGSKKSMTYKQLVDGLSRSQTSNDTSPSVATKHIVVLDEIDNLVGKSQAELMQLLLLPHQPSVCVMMIGIANSIDLTERVLPELKLYMCSPQLICFSAYTSKQLNRILHTCLDQLPCNLFESTAIELCSRSVGTSSGDLRHALKVCRATLDELEHQYATVTATAGITPTVTVKRMMGALARLAGCSSSCFGVQPTSSIQKLPNQQQLLLYSLSVLCTPKDAVDTARNNTSSLWKMAGTASTPSKKGSADSGSQQVFVLAVGLEEAFTQYKQVCKLLSLPPCSRSELQHMAELLAQMALVDVINSSGTFRSIGRCGATGLKGLGGRGNGCRSIGGTSLSKATGLQQDIRLCLKPSVTEVESALKHNPALRCLVDH